MSALVTRVLRPAAIGVLACGLALTGAACSSDDGADTPETTTASQTVPAGDSTAGDSTAGDSTAGDSTLTCAEFRALDDPARTEALRGLGVTSNTDQVATVAATVCLSRPDDKISVVIDELVPGR